MDSLLFWSLDGVIMFMGFILRQWLPVDYWW